MWRVGVLLVLASILADSTADVRQQNSIRLQRLRRSPWPPPPPPPCGPPPFWPPPPPYWRHHHHPPPEYWQYQDQPQQNQAYSVAEARAEPKSLVQQSDKPCDTCGQGNSAVSNAQSGTGDAIAVAVARAKAN